MLEAGRYTKVVNLYDWLPGHGENSVRIRHEGLDVYVIVEFDGQSGGIETKQLLFKTVCAFYKGAFPGPPILGLNYSVKGDDSILGSLIEFPDSEAALSWKRHFSNTRGVKHYKITFPSENIMMEIFASDVVFPT